MSAELIYGFYLGDLLVEPAQGQLTGRKGGAHLPPKAMEVLVCLAKNPGEIVAREDLLDHVWGAGHGSQEALSHAVSEIRHALDDHADRPQFIQTLPRRGYRLLVAPELVSERTSSVVLGAQGGARLTDIGLLESLQRRGVIETGVAYLILGWLLIQIADIVFDQLHLPTWVGTFVTILVIAGFPIALVLSWYLEFRDGRAVLDEISSADARRRRFSRTYLSVIAALGIAAVGVFIFDRIIGLPEPPPEPVIEKRVTIPPIIPNSFAVLPFLNIDGSEETQIFANGLVDDVTGRLARVPGLRVSSRGDAAALAANSTSQQVREQLHVEMYTEGSVEFQGDSLRVIVQLIDSETGFHVLSRSFDGSREEFFAVRDEITSLIVANIRVALPPNVQASSLKVIDDPSIDAYVLYRRGIDVLDQPKSIDTVVSAIGWFDASLEVDPRYAAAHAGKCSAYVSGYTEVDDPAFIDHAKLACATALELNPNLDVVHTALANLFLSTGQYADAEARHEMALSINPQSVASGIGLAEVYLLQQRFDEAEALLRQTIDNHPTDSSTYNAYGFFLYSTGRYREAALEYENVVALNSVDMNGFSNLGTSYMLSGDFKAAAPAFEKAIEIEPTKTAYSNLGLMYYFLGDFDAAIVSHTNATDLKPNDYLARSNLGDALWVAGQVDEARVAFETAEALALDALQVNPNDPFTMMDLAWIRAMLDKPDEARLLMNRVRELVPEDPYAHYYDALVFLRAGDREAALAALEVAADKGYSRHMLAAEPLLAPLRQDPKFVAMTEAG
ncbi:MAG: tetratricopeptide repeat protein [Gammaproteobacteria bacterium]|nr:tetratricopeptide repeat protein [Gammaproteobacteria bacterium]